MSGLFLFCDPDPVLSFIDSVQVQSQSKKNSNIKSKSRWSPKNRKMQPLHKKNAAFLFHSLSPNPVRVLYFDVIHSPDSIQIQLNLL